MIRIIPILVVIFLSIFFIFKFDKKIYLKINRSRYFNITLNIIKSNEISVDFLQFMKNLTLLILEDPNLIAHKVREFNLYQQNSEEIDGWKGKIERYVETVSTSELQKISKLIETARKILYYRSVLANARLRFDEISLGFLISATAHSYSDLTRPTI